ncbi:MAG: hypothetical protein ACLVL6_05975 [Clostridium paraputrificum]|uniref:hypothetical protein n=1 Tax=Clostridium paraputrificum TaxID=29363 RepID=UPI000EA0DA12|nr:hypothetical protein [Clostridium paraputrificum]RKI48024.1 hypothetical protein D7V67_08835 [Clostridium paraputrificum]
MNKNEQKQIILDKFNNKEVREDQYNGESVLMRLAISILYKSDSERENIVKVLKNIDIKPEFIILEDSKSKINVWWFSQRNNVIMNKEQYLRLLDEFIDFVDGLNISEWIIDVGMFGDDTTELNYQVNENVEIIINPSFNRKNFGLNGEPQIDLT